MERCCKYFQDSEPFSSGVKNELVCINAHATSTPLGDKAEMKAVQTLLKKLKVIRSWKFALKRFLIEKFHAPAFQKIKLIFLLGI